MLFTYLLCLFENIFHISQRHISKIIAYTFKHMYVYEYKELCSI